MKDRSKSGAELGELNSRRELKNVYLERGSKVISSGPSSGVRVTKILLYLVSSLERVISRIISPREPLDV